MVITFPVRFPTTIYVCEYKKGPSVLSAQKMRGKKKREKRFTEMWSTCPILNNCPSIALFAFCRWLCLQWHDIIVVIIIIISITGDGHFTRACLLWIMAVAVRECLGLSPVLGLQPFILGCEFMDVLDGWVTDTYELAMKVVD